MQKCESASDIHAAQQLHLLGITHRGYSQPGVDAWSLSSSSSNSDCEHAPPPGGGGDAGTPSKLPRAPQWGAPHTSCSRTWMFVAAVVVVSTLVLLTLGVRCHSLGHIAGHLMI